MARLAFLCDFEVGHLLPSFDLAAHLQNQGHEIHYWVIKDNETLVKTAGFDSTVIFPEIYPPGTIDSFQKLSRSASEKQYFPHVQRMIEGALDEAFDIYKPDIVLTSYFLPLESLLLMYKYPVRIIIFNPSLRMRKDTPVAECTECFMSLEGSLAGSVLNFVTSANQSSVRSLSDIFRPLDAIRELILCPKAMDLPSNSFDDQNVLHVWPRIGGTRLEKHHFEMKPGSKTIIYLSFGSQVSLFRHEYRKLVQQAIQIMQGPEAVDWHLFISLGNALSVEEFDPSPSRVTIAPWLPQLQILETASLMITHGGLGTIKECIMAGVPMLVVPMTRDQPLNADRISFHKLGMKLEIGQCNGHQMLNAMSEILKRSDFKQAVLDMRQLFLSDQMKLEGMDLVA